jgi:hypothetical protein
MAYGGSWPGAKRQRTKRKEVPELNPNDAGFLPEVSLPNFAAAAQRDAVRAAVQSQSQVQSLQLVNVTCCVAPQCVCTSGRVGPVDKGNLKPCAASQSQQYAANVQQQAHQQQRRTLRPSAAQTAAAAGLQQPPPVPAAMRGPEGVLADDEDDCSAALEAAVAAPRAEMQQGSGVATGTSDTLAALLLLAAHFPAAARAAGLSPIMLKAQVYSIVADRTAVDQELEQLRCVKAT